MNNDEDVSFNSDDVLEVSCHLVDQKNVFLVGGQAVAIWAKVFEQKNSVSELGALTSKDIDYYGVPDDARRLARSMRGTYIVPTLDDMNTPNTAIIHVMVNGKALQIDFLNAILGVEKRDLRKGVAEVTLQLKGENSPQVAVQLLHPVLCLQSRIGNMTFPGLARRDETAWRQLEAAYQIVDCYIEDAVASGDLKEGQRCLSDILRFVRTNSAGKACSRELDLDILKLVETRVYDRRLDERFRHKTLAQEVDRLRAKDASRKARRAARQLATTSVVTDIMRPNERGASATYFAAEEDTGLPRGQTEGCKEQ